MYLDHFHLREQPFGVTPDPRYLYQSATHREAEASLTYGIEAGCGLLTLIAPPGMGKTTLLFSLLASLGSRARTSFLFQTQCTAREFMALLLADLGMDAGDRDPVKVHELLKAELLREATNGRRFVVVVDEAQNLDPSVLEALRLLSDFENPRRKLVQIILAGQPELAATLSCARLAQLRQRVSMVIRLAALSSSDTAQYIAHRLQVAGYSGGPLFSPEAVGRIASASGGIPRKINNYCFNALSLAFAMGAAAVSEDMVLQVMHDLALVPGETMDDENRAATVPIALPAIPRGPLAQSLRQADTNSVRSSAGSGDSSLQSDLNFSASQLTAKPTPHPGAPHRPDSGPRSAIRSWFGRFERPRKSATKASGQYRPGRGLSLHDCCNTGDAR